MLIVIPARGGSTGLRRKNILPDAEGTPLVAASVRAALCSEDWTVVVSTDDPEIAAIAQWAGAGIHQRGPELADVPVDDVVRAVAKSESWDGEILLVQPTVHPITTDILRRFVNSARIYREPAALGVEDRHLTWSRSSCFYCEIGDTPDRVPHTCYDGDTFSLLSDRVERQRAAAWPIREVGVRWWPSSSISPPRRVIAAAEDLVDIDTADDYRRLDKRLRIQFEVVAGGHFGYGHLHRALTLAEGLQHHDVAIMVANDDRRASEIVEARGWPRWLPRVIRGADVLVADRLDGWTTGFSGRPVVAFETTRSDADVSINALYGHGDYSGPDYAVLRNEFLFSDYEVREDGASVLILFGGTDPSNLSDLATAALPDVPSTVLRPSDEKSVVAAMEEHDLVLTSGGRTVYEAAAVGIPAVVLAQNQRELTHAHLGVGNLSLGLGRLVDPYALRRLVVRLLDDYPTRLDLSETAKASIDGRGAERCRRIIEHVGLFGRKP